METVGVLAQVLASRGLQPEPVANDALTHVLVTSRAAANAETANRAGEPGGVGGHELAGGQVRQAGTLELGDGLLDDRVPPVVGLDFRQWQVPVGDERVIVPRW